MDESKIMKSSKHLVSDKSSKDIEKSWNMSVALNRKEITDRSKNLYLLHLVPSSRYKEVNTKTIISLNSTIEIN